MMQNQFENAIVERHAARCVAAMSKWRDWWSGDRGWAPSDVEVLLRKVKLDRIESLCCCLPRLAQEPLPHQTEGALVMAWTAMGAITECALKLFLCIWRGSYQRNGGITSSAGQMLDPDRLNFENARQFCVKHVWDREECHEVREWLSLVQSRRNAIHAFKSAQLGSWDELLLAVGLLAEFLEQVEGQLPYPD